MKRGKIKGGCLRDISINTCNCSFYGSQPSVNFFSYCLERVVAKNERSDLIGQEDMNDVKDETSH